MRLDRFVCKSTELDRDSAVREIMAGNVQVNGDVVTEPSGQVHESNRITLAGEILTPRPFRYIMLHKPADTICSNVDETYPSLFRSLDIDRVDELHIVGRLDADTTGLVLMTDDGRWSFNITSPKYQCDKCYRVWLRDPLAEDVAARFQQGILLQGEAKATLPAILVQEAEREVLLTLTEGRFHQVKRMFKAVGNRVVRLHREKIGALQLDVAEGDWRYLTRDEVVALQKSD